MSEAVANTPASGTGSAPSAPSAPAPATKPSASAGPKPSNNGQTSAQFRSFLKSDAPISSPSVDLSSDDDEGEYSEPEAEASDDSSETSEAEETEQEPGEEDESWLEKIKGHRKLHGLDLEAVVEALAEGRLPDELMDIIKIKLKNGDQEWESPLSKARNEAMLHQDYTRKLQAFGIERDDFNAGKDEFVGMLQTWKGEGDKFPKGDPRRGEALLHGLEHLEFPIEEAAMALAHRLRKLDQMTPEQRQLFEERNKFEKESKAFKAEQAKLQQAQQSEKNKANTEGKVAFVNKTAEGLFAKAGIPVNENTWRLFIDDFKVITSSYAPGADWTPEMIENAFYSMADKYQSVLARKQQQAAAGKNPQAGRTAGGQFTSPAREQVAAAGLTQKVQGPRAKPRNGGSMSSSDFRKKFLSG